MSPPFVPAAVTQGQDRSPEKIWVNEATVFDDPLFFLAKCHLTDRFLQSSLLWCTGTTIGLHRRRRRWFAYAERPLVLNGSTSRTASKSSGLTSLVTTCNDAQLFVFGTSRAKDLFILSHSIWFEVYTVSGSGRNNWLPLRICQHALAMTISWGVTFWPRVIGEEANWTICNVGSSSSSMMMIGGSVRWFFCE